MTLILDDIIQIDNSDEFQEYIDILRREPNNDPINNKYVGCSLTCRRKIVYPYYVDVINRFDMGYVIMHKHDYFNKDSLKDFLKGYDPESSDEELEIIYPGAYIFITEKEFDYIKLELICVDIKHSGKGYARFLMERLFEYYDEYHFGKIILDAVDHDAKDFFAYFGFVFDASRHVLNMGKEIPMKYER